MAPLTARSLVAPSPLAVTHQVRFTEEQDRLLRELSRGYRRNLSAVLRDIVVSWAVNVTNEESSLTGEPPVIDVHACVAELHRLAELEDES